MEVRIEKDTMGEVEIPAWALWGPNTERARRNLPIDPEKKMPQAMIVALARIKAAMAKAAENMGFIEAKRTGAIVEAAAKIEAGEAKEHFPLDVFQTGSGTSSNMNVNEVIANLANIALGGQAGEGAPVHPNDHVNFGQSSNDTIPSALHLAALDRIENALLPQLNQLAQAIEEKAVEYKDVVKNGRTHLQDALPITFGHVFRGYADALRRLENRIAETCGLLSEIPLGGTAVGTGFQAPEGLVEKAAEFLSSSIGRNIRIADEPLAFMAGRPVASDVMGRVAALAMELSRFANDIRMMASGPRLGFGELEIPSLQPGSSIMPGKVNPVVCESVVQAGMVVQGNMATVLAAAAGGQFELNVTLPVTAYALIGSIDIMAAECKVLREKLVVGMKVRVDAVGKGLDNSLALATALISKIGYAKAAEIAYQAHNDNSTVAQAVVKMGILKPDEVEKWLDPAKLTKRGRLTD